MIRTLHILDTMVGHDNIGVDLGDGRDAGSQFSTNPIYLFMAGPQEGVLQVSLRRI